MAFVDCIFFKNKIYFVKLLIVSLVGIIFVPGDFLYAQSNSDALIQQTKEKLGSEAEKNKPKNSYLPPGVADGPFSSRAGTKKQGENELAIKIRRVRVKGATIFSADELAGCYRSLIGRTIGENELATLTDCITDIYHKAGYNLSRAVVPPQDVDKGRLIVQVIEGYVFEVKFEGVDAARFRADRFAQPIMAERPLKLETLERQLLLISDIPGFGLKDTLLEEAGEMTGRFVLTIVAESWDVWSGAEIDNRGSDSIGPYQSFQSVSLNSLLGFGETIGIGYSSIVDSFDELHFGTASLTIPLNEYGLTLSAYISSSVSQPNDIRKTINTKFKTIDGGVNLQWAALRTRKTSLWVGGGIWARNNKDENDFGTYVKDKLQGISLFARLQHEDRFKGITYIYANLKGGLDLGDSSEKGDANLSRFDGDGEFTRFNLDVTRLQVIDDNWSLLLSGSLQLGSEGLLSSQEFYFGGARFGRAYESGVVSGDSGAAASVELRYTRNIESDYMNGFQLYAFADIGSIFDDGNSFANGALLSSAGAGVRLYLPYGFEADMSVAFPIDDDDLSNAKDEEYYFRVSRSFKLDEFRLDKPRSWFQGAFKK